MDPSREASKRGAPPSDTHSTELHFSLFPKLPSELRCMIYSSAFPRRWLGFYGRWRDRAFQEMHVLGPPPVANTCREAREYALLHYHLIPFRWVALVRNVDMPRLCYSPQTSIIWFNPAVDVLYLPRKHNSFSGPPVVARCWAQHIQDAEDENAARHGAQRGTAALGEDRRARELARTAAGGPRQPAFGPGHWFSNTVRAVLPFTRIAETIVVEAKDGKDDSQQQVRVNSQRLVHFADKSIFPRLRTVLVALDDPFSSVDEPVDWPTYAQVDLVDLHDGRSAHLMRYLDLPYHWWRAREYCDKGGVVDFDNGDRRYEGFPQWEGRTGRVELAGRVLGDGSAGELLRVAGDAVDFRPVVMVCKGELDKTDAFLQREYFRVGQLEIS